MPIVPLFQGGGPPKASPTSWKLSYRKVQETSSATCTCWCHILGGVFNDVIEFLWNSSMSLPGRCFGKMARHVKTCTAVGTRSLLRTGMFILATYATEPDSLDPTHPTSRQSLRQNLLLHGTHRKHSLQRSRHRSHHRAPCSLPSA